MQAPISARTPDTAMTPLAASLFSEASGHRSISTGKERDSESGNDYFDARYYSSTMGRFMSPDWSAKEDPVPYAKLDNPQTLNLYAYVLNNPLARADADGHCPECVVWEQEAEPVIEDYGNQLLNWAGATASAGFAWGSGLAQKTWDAASSVNWSNFNYSSSDPIPMNQMQSSSSSSSAQAPASAPAGGQSTPANPGPNAPYKRPNNATTKEQRDSVQGKPCSTCGATGQKNVANHIDPLVEQHYRGGIDPAKMHDPNAVNAQCPTCSAQQGGLLRTFSQAMKKLFGF
jgi:RHS repeat-associated protein